MPTRGCYHPTIPMLSCNSNLANYVVITERATANNGVDAVFILTTYTHHCIDNAT